MISCSLSFCFTLQSTWITQLKKRPLPQLFDNSKSVMSSFPTSWRFSLLVIFLSEFLMASCLSLLSRHFTGFTQCILFNVKYSTTKPIKVDYSSLLSTARTLHCQKRPVQCCKMCCVEIEIHIF